MTTPAFQANAFQNNAFQTVPSTSILTIASTTILKKPINAVMAGNQPLRVTLTPISGLITFDD